ncbi:hypothetical protein MITSMUL_05151 [Mitsuokella multacida DSM 20544]|uniref:Uncharacterized protein n=1 Tax=Mitsuokella multacida DSM 20544 TaxID=500635 RepID=C9KPJ4_9FIRM|nr:hypothetical protein MITSMUL_05151 [Mitsuokella multacida DSM 20544]
MLKLNYESRKATLLGRFFQCIQRYINYFHEAVFESKIKKEEC